MWEAKKRLFTEAKTIRHWYYFWVVAAATNAGEEKSCNLLVFSKETKLHGPGVEFTRIESHNIDCSRISTWNHRKSHLFRTVLLPQSCWAKFTVEAEIRALYKRLCWKSCMYCLRKSRMTQKNPGDRNALASKLPRLMDSFSSDLYTRYMSRSACSCESLLAT